MTAAQTMMTTTEYSEYGEYGPFIRSAREQGYRFTFNHEIGRYELVGTDEEDVWEFETTDEIDAFLWGHGVGRAKASLTPEDADER